MTTCVWWERTSASLDGELPEAELALVETHVAQCAACSNASTAAKWIAASVPDDDPVEFRRDRLSRSQRAWLHPGWTRALLFAAAAAIVAEAVPTYVNGRHFGPEAHFARHLATWQIGFGVGMIVAATMSRLTYAMLALASTLATLTITASLLDISMGHSALLAESVHLIEIAGVLLLWRVAPPNVLPWHRDERRTHREQGDPTSRQTKRTRSSRPLAAPPRPPLAKPRRLILVVDKGARSTDRLGGRARDNAKTDDPPGREFEIENTQER